MSQFLKAKEAADFLRVKVTTIYKWVRENEVPYRKHGGKIIFALEDLISWSTSNKNKPDTEVQNARKAKK